MYIFHSVALNLILNFKDMFKQSSQKNSIHLARFSPKRKVVQGGGSYT
jgi:hypothetical protein